MVKWKDRINNILDKETEKLKIVYRDAEGNYRDTGYSRYYNKMEKLERELADIEDYRHSKLAIAQAEFQARKYRSIISTFKKQARNYAEDHPGVDRPVSETVRNLLLKLEVLENQ